MNSTFKLTPAGAQFDIIQYTAPPPSKPRRPQGSQRREAIPERYSLPDLAPDSLFDGLDGLQAPSGILDSVHTPSLDRVREISSPSTPDAGVVDLNFAAERPDREMVPEESALEEIDESQQSTSERTSYADLRVLDRRKLSLSISMPVATSNLGVDNSSPNSGGEAHDENASADSAQSDDDKDSHGRAGQGLGSEEPGSPYDDMISSDPEISDTKFGNVVDEARSDKSRSEPRQGALQSAGSRPRVVIPRSHTRFGQSSPKVVLPYPRDSTRIKAPRFPAGTTSRAFGHEVEHLPPRTKRRGSTMASQLHKRNRRSGGTNQARVDSDICPSDSDSSYDGECNLATAEDVRQRQRQPASQLSGMSKAVGASKWKLRSGRRTSSTSSHSPSGVLSRSAEDTQIPNAQSGPHGDGMEEANSSPGPLNPNTTPVVSTESAVLTVLLADTTEIGALLKSPAAWGFAGNLFSTARLINATVKPYASKQWQLTATFSRVPSVNQSARDPILDTDTYSSSADSDHSSSSMYSIHHYPSENESGSRTRRTRRGGWEDDDDKNLIKWRRLGKPWPWICEKFPDRTEAAVKSHWYVVLAPREKSER